jgi:hypothetical protein
MSTRSGSGALSIKPTKSKLRAIGRKGNNTQRANANERRTYSDTVPF